ncbi:hypothetical protein TUM3794_07270 [Shewanella colwelliana]|uniref:Peptidase MA-like domain-containing protein n=2 Tax=Shewanella colwelliana TaxID=23 RepID=A0ABQ4NVQ9_SHECO|nr:hypothetical protein [Shewanella colwelliana]GIU37092.1 hypothetical protein TUM3794_07270 [Shewanella colwelliana]
MHIEVGYRVLAEALFIASGWFWAPISQTSQALVCHTPQLELCLAQLPSTVKRQLPSNRAQLRLQMGGRGAMARPVSHSSIAGVVFLSVENIPMSSSALWGGEVYALPLAASQQLTLIHELGHLATARLPVDYWGQEGLTPYQHEWLADFYLVWHLAKQGEPMALAWQQYHKRNLAVFESVQAMSHWTTPMLSQLLARYTWQQLGQFERFSALIAEVYPHLHQYKADELNEFSSLLQQLFGASKLHDLPQYMFWRRPAMAQYIRPTLERMMGQQAATAWLVEQAMNSPVHGE